MLYHARKYELGCPTEKKCDIYASQQEAGCATCPKHLKPVPKQPLSPAALRRVAFLTRIESRVAVGCKYGPDDLPQHVWDELVWLRIERDRLDELIRERKKGPQSELPPPVERQRQEVRKMDGIPAPGQSLFPRKR